MDDAVAVPRFFGIALVGGPRDGEQLFISDPYVGVIDTVRPGGVQFHPYSHDAGLVRPQGASRHRYRRSLRDPRTYNYEGLF